MAIAQLLEGQGYTEEVAFEKLQTSPLNTYDATDIEDLVTNIRYCGLITPLSVVGPDTDGNYEILSGERRYKAITAIREEDGSFQTVPCCVIGPADMDRTVKRIIVECANLETRNDYDKDAHRFTLVGLYHELADKGTIDQQEIARQIEKTLSVSRRYARMYNSIYINASPELLEAVKAPSTYGSGASAGKGMAHIPVAVASRAVQFPGEIQREIVDRIQGGEKAADVVQEYVEKYKDLEPGEETVTPVFAPVPDPVAPYGGMFSHSAGQEPAEPIRPAAGSNSIIDPEIRDGSWLDGEVDLGDVDIDVMFETMMESDPGNIDLTASSVLTRGEMNLLRQEQGGAPSKLYDLGTVSRWLGRMLKRTDFSDLTEEEADLMQSVCELALHYQTSLAEAADI